MQAECVHRTRYRFSHRSNDGKTYYWYSAQRVAGDSRVEEIRCNVDWFWGHRQNS